MASLSNIKFSSRKSPWGFLWLLLFCSTALKAQNYFNKTYFMGGYNNAIRNIMPLGNDGNSIAFAYNFDSISGNNTLKLLKFDKFGNKYYTNILQHPNAPDTLLSFWNFNEACKIHNNLYAVVTVRNIKGVQWGSSLFLVDSNAQILHYTDILIPVSGAKDTFSLITALAYDSLGHIIAAGHNGSELYNNNVLLLKFDTSLNLLWSKTYIPKAKDALDDFFIGDLDIHKDKYIIFGGAENHYMYNDSRHRNQALIMATDTAGLVDWTYVSPMYFLKQCQSTIFSGIACSDGGYAYISSTDVFNFYGDNPYFTDPWGMLKIIKLDSNRTKVWEQNIDNVSIPFGSPYYYLKELPDNSIALVHTYTQDTLPKGLYLFDYLFSRYNADGSLRYHHKLYPPLDAGDTDRLKSSWWAFDFCIMPDKGFLLGGGYRNETRGTATYAVQKIWVVHLDSNGYLAPGDTNCVNLGIKKWQEQLTTAYTPFKLYPNPSTGLFRFSTEDTKLIGQNLSLSVYDLNGVLVLQKNFSLGACILDLSSAATGLYSYRISLEQQIIDNGKLIKY